MGGTLEGGTLEGAFLQIGLLVLQLSKHKRPEDKSWKTFHAQRRRHFRDQLYYVQFDLRTILED